MQEFPLFYSSVVPLNRDRHRSLHLREDGYHHGFARGANVIPAVVDEFPVACRHLPIVFMPGVKHPTAVFVTGLRSGTNAFVAEDGRWTGDYIPAFVRRYPFIIGEVEGSEPLACIDEKFPGFEDTSGDKLFGDDGVETDLLQQRVRLIRDYYDAAKRTDQFMSLLTELNLLRGVTIEAKSKGSETITIQGYLTVDEAKLADMPANEFLRLRRENLLAPIYAHLLSLASVDKLQHTASRADAPLS